MVELTKDTDKLICCVYKTYLERRNNGMLKVDASRFEDNFYTSDEKLSKWHISDVNESLIELSKAKYIRLTITGAFSLEPPLLIHMENRFKNGVRDVVEMVSKFL